jgi:hypothetical protein
MEYLRRKRGGRRGATREGRKNLKKREFDENYLISSKLLFVY